VPLLGLLVPPLYNSADPTLIGMLRALRAPAGEDITRPEDYEADRGEPGVTPLPPTPEQKPAPAGRA
jgi:hypothetical protein